MPRLTVILNSCKQMNKMLTLFLFLSVTAILAYTSLSLLSARLTPQPHKQLKGQGTPTTTTPYPDTGKKRMAQKKDRHKEHASNTQKQHSGGQANATRRQRQQPKLEPDPMQPPGQVFKETASDNSHLKKRPKVKADSRKQRGKATGNSDANEQNKQLTLDTADDSNRLKKGPKIRPKDKAGARKQTKTEKENSFKDKGSTVVVSPSSGSGEKYLVYLCHGRQLCGGWADRQRGLVSVFFLALVTGRKFAIIMDFPCNVTHFYQPRDVNWIVPRERFTGRSSTVIGDMGSRARLTSRLLTMDFNQEYPQDVVYIKTNNPSYHKTLMKSPRYAPRLPQWALSKSSSYVFKEAWKRLMRPSEYLQGQLDAYLSSIQFTQRTHPLVCCHVRIGKSDTIRNDGKTRMNVSDIKVLWEFLDPYVRNGSRVFLATDNHQVRNLTRQKFGSNMTDTGRSIVHVDRASRNDLGSACQGFGDALLDQLILTLCDVLIVGPSGFSSRAAFLRGTSDNLFRFAKRKSDENNGMTM